MSTKLITPGELAVGQFVTVLEWEPIVHEPDGMFTTTKTVYRDNSYKGDVLKVAAIDLPFLIVDRQSKYEFERNAIKLDTRRVSLMELSPEYINAHSRT
jgi:hypothetical protein